jgi:hypothetical protein
LLRLSGYGEVLFVDYAGQVIFGLRNNVGVKIPSKILGREWGCGLELNYFVAVDQPHSIAHDAQVVMHCI